MASCDKGGGDACYDLGQRYKKGDGVARDPARAVALFERSGDTGYAGNCWYLGSVYERGGFGLVAPDVNRAASLHRKGCDREGGNSCFSLGLLGWVDLASGFCEDAGGFAYLGAAYRWLGMQVESDAARDRILALDPGILNNPVFKVLTAPPAPR